MAGSLTERHRDTEFFGGEIWSWGSTPDPERQSIACDLLAFGVWGSAPALNPLCASVALCEINPPRAAPCPKCQSIACDLLAFGVWGSAPASNPLCALCLSAPLREIFPPHSISKSLPHHSVSLCLCVSSSHYPTTIYQLP